MSKFVFRSCSTFFMTFQAFVKAENGWLMDYWMQNDTVIAFSNVFFGFLYIFANFEQLNLLLGIWIRPFQNFVNPENLIDYLMQNIDSIAFSNVFFGFLYIFPIWKQLNLGNWNELWCPYLEKFHEYFLFC